MTNRCYDQKNPLPGDLVVASGLAQARSPTICSTLEREVCFNVNLIKEAFEGGGSKVFSTKIPFALVSFLRRQFRQCWLPGLQSSS
ncbi:hypothetical protein E2C01_066755 [Portunus trituberculatus]|uniref:Uncharacterized protein n=1 Tax=Portunus trituberculatus TaxID=210409 RepID=A0A5B7HRR2_PORTR|nr:hypothetical protein [Portunus trituberculatus]